MINILVIFLLLLVSNCVYSKVECPEKYLRLSKDHSYCKAPNATCEIMFKGFPDEEEKQWILDVHNYYRNFVAMGEETQAGGMPTAANMLELIWDDELAEIALKWAEQCYFQHDCAACRSTDRFYVGQNLGLPNVPLEPCSEPGGFCVIDKVDWEEIIDAFYYEMEYYDKSLVKSHVQKEEYGHLTQVLWADTYRIGCAYVAYKDGYGKQLLACNYGPGGNAAGYSVYKEGPPCSKCPINSCCGEECEEEAYPGLCHLLSTPPVYNSLKTVYSCSFEKEDDQSCKFDAEGDGTWKMVKTTDGNFISIVVEGGKTFSIRFHQLIKVKRGYYMTVVLRRGAAIGGEVENNEVEMIFEINGESKLPSRGWAYLSGSFAESGLEIDDDGDLKFTIKFIVPEGAPAQYLDIKQIEMLTDPCDLEGFEC